MIDRYKTVEKEAWSEFVEKKSRFITNIRPVAEEEEAIRYIEGIKKKYYDARHNVYAYIIGKDSRLQRYSDDGEPQGTGGIPMLEVLKGEKVTDCVAVVTRYFGGTLLGTGGLARAYSKGAKDGLLASGIVEMVLFRQVNIKVDYTLSGKVQYEIMQQGCRLKDTVYTADVEFVALTETGNAESLVKRMTDITGGKAVITMGENCWLEDK